MDRGAGHDGFLTFASVSYLLPRFLTTVGCDGWGEE